MSTIAQNLARIQSAKADIKAAIEAKGVTVPSSATIDTYDDYVAQITGGGGIPMPSKLSSASFSDYGLITSAEIKSGVTTIGDSAFLNCYSLTSCTIGNSVTSIGNYAFAGCNNLTSIEIPNSVTSIGNHAFQNCISLTSCTIGSSVTSIGENAFYGCWSLTSVTVNATTPPTLGNSAFNNTNNCPIYVPSGSVSAYQSAWSDYSSRIQAIPNS